MLRVIFHDIREISISPLSTLSSGSRSVNSDMDAFDPAKFMEPEDLVIDPYLGRTNEGVKIPGVRHQYSMVGLKKVSGVRNQGMGNNCANIVGADNTVSAFLYYNKEQEDLELPILSAQHPIDCMGNWRTEFDTAGCKLANYSEIYNFICAHGLFEEKYYPFKGKKQSCQEKYIFKNKKKGEVVSTMKITRADRVKKQDTKYIEKLLDGNLPLSASIPCHREMRDYKGEGLYIPGPVETSLGIMRY